MPLASLPLARILIIQAFEAASAIWLITRYFALIPRPVRIPNKPDLPAVVVIYLKPRLWSLKFYTPSRKAALIESAGVGHSFVQKCADSVELALAALSIVKYPLLPIRTEQPFALG